MEDGELLREEVLRLANHYGKVGVIAGLTTFVLLIVGVRNIVGHTIEILNFIAFSIFGLIIGVAFTALLFYRLKIAFPIFFVSCIVAFFEMFRSYITDVNGQGAEIGILSLFIFTSFGLGLALIVQFGVMFIRKKK